MLDILSIGTVTRDVFLTSSNFKVLKDPKHLETLGFKTGEAECFALGSKIEVQKPVFTTGGGAANAAVTFRRHGLKTGLIAKLGDDELGGAVVDNLKKEKIKISASKEKNINTAYSTILITDSGERTVLVYRGASGDLTKKDIFSGKLDCKWTYISPGAIPFPVINEAIALFKKKGIKIAMNLSKHYLEIGAQKLMPILKNIDLVVVSREEASYLTGIPYKNERLIFKKFDDLISGIAVVTDGARGAKVSDGKYLYSAGIFKEKKLVDRTGAGDAFGSGFVAGLIEKSDIHYALRFAAANATSVVEQIGAQAGILTKKDFLKNKRWKYLDLDVEPL
ncbi:MAG: carbohydrate kinase family protein [Patescibacteria group bacterium]|nr:carbohydrate kinase family protein [Patescibacteria group bacterium]